jgi:ABC-type Fe3+/spermidine/putrescine transport system ATPase subunit
MITVRGLTRAYGDRVVLDGLDLDLSAGQMLALLGPSGSGKSTALRIIAGLDLPTSGEVICDGRTVLGRTDHAVMVFQNALLFPHMSVAENVGFGLKMRGKSDPAAVAEMLALVQLPGLGGRRPDQLSGGQAQRVALARALILRPRVLLLDEPLSNLDANLRHEMRDLIREIQRKMGLTTIMVTHDQQEAVVLADQIALIMDGRLQQMGAAFDFFSRPKSVAVARFFGGVNFIAGAGDGRAFQSALGALPMQVTGRGVVTIRPERIKLGGPIKARLIDRQYMGNATVFRVLAADQILQITAGPDAVVQDDLSLTLPPEALWFIPDVTE